MFVGLPAKRVPGMSDRKKVFSSLGKSVVTHKERDKCVQWAEGGGAHGVGG